MATVTAPGDTLLLPRPTLVLHVLGQAGTTTISVLQVHDFSTDSQASASPCSLLVPVPLAGLLPGEWGFSILWLPEQSMKKTGITLQLGWTKTGIAVIVMPKLS